MTQTAGAMCLEHHRVHRARKGARKSGAGAGILPTVLPSGKTKTTAGLWVVYYVLIG